MSINTTMIDTLDESLTHAKRPKFVKKWIASDRLRAKWWNRSCPECGSRAMLFQYQKTSRIQRVKCFDCEWSDE